MAKLVIRVESDEISDLQWLQPGVEAAVVNYVDKQQHRMDDENIRVSWEWED